MWYIYIYHILFIHSSFDGHLGCFHILAIVNNATINIGCMYLLELLFLGCFQDIYPRVELLCYMVVLFFFLIGVQLFYNVVLVSTVQRRWMDLDTVIQSEVSQKNKYHILTRICGIQKNGTDELVCKAEIETQMQRTNIPTSRGRGQGMG